MLCKAEPNCTQGIPGDVDGDCTVNLVDFSSMASNWQHDSNCEPNVAEDWVALYDGPATFVDRGSGIAVDNSGNIYVTGDSWGPGTKYDYVTVKYDSNGTILWEARYHGLGDMPYYEDYAKAIAVDDNGNVHVTGYSYGTSLNYDYATVKYDSNGNELWVARYNGPADLSDFAYAITVDTSGNVYVTGTSEGDYATVKYDSEGNQLWIARYDAGNDDEAGDIAVDTNGNIYVTGESEDSKGDPDYATVKYDSDGNQVWAVRYNGPDNDWDRATSIALDASGNIYVTGNSDGGSATYSDFATIKYTPAGSQVWVARYNGPANSSDSARAIAIDNQNNIYVTGSSRGVSTEYDYATVKYEPNGNQCWAVRFNGTENDDDLPEAISTDSSGNVYVTGYSTDPCGHYDYDYATVKYSTDGDELWVSTYNGAGNEYRNIDHAYGIALDNVGNVYITGESWGPNTYVDYATIKYDSNGNEIWVALYDGPATHDDFGYAMAIDGNDNLYVTGESYGPNAQEDYLTIKYDPNGNKIWEARYDGTAEEGWMTDTAHAVAVDDSGNVYVTGESWGQETHRDYATVKYNTNGNQLWVARYNGLYTDSYDEARCIAIDEIGNVYVTGSSGSDSATIKYDTNGNELWVKRDGPSGSVNMAMAVDSYSNVYVTGSSGGDYATVKYDSNGNELWATSYNGPGNSDDYPYAITVDSLGNAYVTGSSYGSGTSRDIATIKYDPNGNELWVVRYDGPANDYDYAQAMTIDDNNNIYVSGYSAGLGTNSDYATIKYDQDGNELWVARYDGPNNGYDYALAIAVDSKGNTYVTGQIESVYIRDDDYATVKYDPNGNELWVAIYDGLGEETRSSYADVARAIEVDSHDDVYVFGESWGLGTYSDYTLIKYSSVCDCIPEVLGDTNNDCEVDFIDLAVLARHWLECNIDPPEACW